MIKFAKRFYHTYSNIFSSIFVTGGVCIFFGPFLKASYDQSVDPNYFQEPKRKAHIEQTERRHAYIKKRYAEYKACKDPVEKAAIYKELSDIQVKQLLERSKRDGPSF